MGCGCPSGHGSGYHRNLDGLNHFYGDARSSSPNNVYEKSFVHVDMDCGFEGRRLIPRDANVARHGLGCCRPKWLLTLVRYLPVEGSGSDSGLASLPRRFPGPLRLSLIRYQLLQQLLRPTRNHSALDVSGSHVRSRSVGCHGWWV